MISIDKAAERRFLWKDEHALKHLSEKNHLHISCMEKTVHLFIQLIQFHSEIAQRCVTNPNIRSWLFWADHWEDVSLTPPSTNCWNSSHRFFNNADDSQTATKDAHAASVCSCGKHRKHHRKRLISLFQVLLSKTKCYPVKIYICAHISG